MLMKPAQRSGDVLFGRFRVDCNSLRLFSGGDRLPISKTAVRVLLVLYANPHETVTKEELLETVWESRDVTGNAVEVAVSVVRQALRRGDADTPYIRTDYKGYSWVYQEPHQPAVTGSDTVSASGVSAPVEASVWSTGLVRELRELHPASFYRFGSSWADVICLEGAGTETFPPHFVHITFESPYEMPSVLSVERALHQERIVSLWKAKYPALHPGDCIGLASYSTSVHDSQERKHLHATLRRLTWYDYMFSNQRLGDGELMKLFPNELDVSQFIDFPRLVEHNDLSASQLSNIVPLYVTATTTDGYLVYSRRSIYGVSSEGGLLISAVSENINPEVDGILKDGSGLSLFNAAARGIERELSWSLDPANPAVALSLIGLGFDLKQYHPCLLFYVPFPYSRAQIESCAVEKRGIEHQERKGLPKFVHLDDRTSLDALMARSDWFPAGKASVIRTIEFLAASAKERSCTLPEMAAMFSREHAW